MPPKEDRREQKNEDPELWGDEEEGSKATLTYIGDDVNYKEFIKQPLPDFELIMGDPTSQRTGKVPGTVVAQNLNGKVKKILKRLPEATMKLSSPGGTSCVLESEASTNAEQQRTVFEVVNHILAQMPVPFYRQFRIRLNALATDKEFSERESLGGMMTDASNNLLLPDNECLRCYNSEGEVDLRARSAVSFEGKRWGVFAKDITDPEVINTGKFNLADAYNDKELGKDAMSAVHQIVGYLVDRGLERGILYTLVVMWVITIITFKPLTVGISDPYTWDCTSPSVLEVTLAVTCEALDKLKLKDKELRLEDDVQRLNLDSDGGDKGGESRDKGGPSKGAQEKNTGSPPNSTNPAPPSSNEPSNEQSPSEDEPSPKQAPAEDDLSPEQAPSEDELSAEQPPSEDEPSPEQPPSEDEPSPEQPPSEDEPSPEQHPSEDELSGEQVSDTPSPEQAPSVHEPSPKQHPFGGPEAGPGDQMLKQLEDKRAAHHGNSLVRFGMLNGQPVAAKVAYSQDPEWFDELENEVRVLDSLKSLQGSIVPQKVYSGPVHGGKDRLLVTKLVNGRRLDRLDVTLDVAKSARKALAEIHNQGFVHGDVQSRNILVERSGHCVFVDLGRAKRATDENEFVIERTSLDATLRNNW